VDFLGEYMKQTVEDNVAQVNPKGLSGWLPSGVSALLFIVMLFVSSFIISSIKERLNSESQIRTTEFARNFATIFELSINRSLSAAVLLGANIEESNGDITDWQTQAAIIYYSLGGITNLQLAPDAIVQKIFPLRDGDEKAFGHNLIKDDERRIEADLAIKTRSMTMAGPFNLVQGGQAIVGRYPIFIPSTSPFLAFKNTGSMSYALQGTDRFWGYATALIDFGQVLNTSGLISLPAQGYEYRLWRLHPDTGVVDVISESSGELSSNKVAREIQLPNAIWVIELDAAQGLTNAYSQLIRWSTAITISVIASVVVFFLLLWPSHMARKVKSRTKELSAAKRHLERITSQYETILDSTAEGIYGVDENGHIVFANPAAVAAFGGLSADLVGASQYTTFLKVALDGSIYNRNDCPIKKSIFLGNQMNVRHAVFSSIYDDTFNVEYTCRPVTVGDQELVAVIVFRDTSERDRLEADQLLASYAFETSNAIMITDGNGKILRINNSFTRMTGYLLSDVIGQPMSFFNFLDTHSHSMEDIAGQVNKSGLWSGEIVAFRKNKSKVTGSVTINKVSNKTNTTINYLVHIQDISARKLADEQLQEQIVKAETANKAKSEFLAMMSHEIRTPLSGVMGLLDLLLHTNVDVKQAEYITTAIESGDALLTVINDVLDFSKMEADKLELEKSIFEPVPLINSVSLLMSPRAQAKGLVFLTETSGDMPAVLLGDAGRLRQVLLNLVSNAIKFTTAGSVLLRLTASADDSNNSKLVFEVIDTGIGITEENRTHLFEKFSTVDASYSRRFGGTGLGLSISNQLVTLMGGKIGVDSAVDRGSRFWFRVLLPIAVKPQTLHDAKDKKDKVSDIKGHILVAEDVMANRLVIKEVLQRRGLTVHMVENGLEAVQAVKLTAFDAVLMDVSMPEMDGIQATAAIRALTDDRKAVPIIAMTAHALKGDKEHFIASGMDDYLTKPIEPNKLIATLAKWIMRKDTKVVAGSEATAKSTKKSKKSDSESETAESVGSMSIEGILDTGILEQMAEDTSRDLVPTLGHIFIRDARSRLVKMSISAELSEWESIGMNAHAIAGSSLAYGLPELATLSRAVEYAIKNNEIDQAEKEMKILLLDAPLHLNALEQYLKAWS